MMRLTKLLILISVCCALLVACTNIASTGAGAVYNRRSIEKNFSDQYITWQAYQQLFVKRHSFKATNIVISTFNSEVLLAGQVPEAKLKEEAERIVRKISGVKEVYNLIRIKSPTSSLTKINDSWLTTKVKSKLIASNDVDASQIKVVTENSTVFLMGTLSPAEAQAAIEIARDTDGVASVVKIFSYVTISKRPPIMTALN